MIPGLSISLTNGSLDLSKLIGLAMGSMYADSGGRGPLGSLNMSLNFWINDEIR